MDLGFKDNRTVEILMVDYTKECFETFGEEISNGVNTPAKHNLFGIDDVKTMCEEKIEIFHHIIAKLFFVSKRSRVDINLEIQFLCTRVSKSTAQDWIKLKRLL